MKRGEGRRKNGRQVYWRHEARETGVREIGRQEIRKGDRDTGRETGDR